MNKALTPVAEQLRLAALRSLHILDTPPEERYDRLTRMAKRMFDVPVALISLTDANRQWYKSCVGLAAMEAPRETSFCNQAILQDDVLIVPDASVDERFAANPLVLYDGVRFYAGCPLKSPDGHMLGTLCIMDQKPRSLFKEDMGALQDLAAMVENELAAIQLATIDDLTSIANRRGFLLFAQHSLALCMLQQLPGALFFLDVDSYLHINTSGGRAATDQVLKDFADLLKRTFRQADCYGRIGVAEFAVFLTNTDKAQADNILARFSSRLYEYNRQDGRGHVIECTFGVVEFEPGVHHDINAMLKDGAALMSQRKRVDH